MQYIKQFAIIVAICLVGEFVVSFLPFAFPGNVAAMIILAGLLVIRVVKEEHIKETSDFLLQIIALFIVPPSVAVIQYFDLIGAIWWQLIIISLITLFLTFAACTFTIRLTMKLMNRKKRNNELGEM